MRFLPVAAVAVLLLVTGQEFGRISFFSGFGAQTFCSWFCPEVSGFSQLYRHVSIGSRSHSLFIYGLRFSFFFTAMTSRGKIKQDSIVTSCIPMSKKIMTMQKRKQCQEHRCLLVGSAAHVSHTAGCAGRYDCHRADSMHE